MAVTRIFFATDTHGSSVCFRKFINAGKFYEAHVIILGGDITGKKVIPFVRQSDGSFKVNHLDRQHVLKDGEQVEALRRNIADMGYYPFMTAPEELDQLADDQVAQDTIFKDLMKDRISEGLRFAEERLDGTNIRCFVQPGNDDEFDIDALFEASTLVVNPEGQVIQIDEHYTMISTGYGNITPWRCPRDVLDEELESRIDTMAGQVGDFEYCIFNFHCPPYDTVLDQAPELDDQMRPVLEMGGKPHMIPVGSKAVRKAIDKYQPRLGLHGHIHESRGSQKLGRTTCLNPGSEYGEGVLRGVIVDIDKKGIKAVTFTSG
ncbi:MAG TPA: metallophosphoesterase [Thermoleophilia bacterium]|nr:metallophosphoesterase [Thermoleophilia bacterium]